MGRGERNHMKKENNFLDLMGEIDEKFVYEASLPWKKRNVNLKLKLAKIAAGVVIALLIGGLGHPHEIKAAWEQITSWIQTALGINENVESYIDSVGKTITKNGISITLDEIAADKENLWVAISDNINDSKEKETILLTEVEINGKAAQLDGTYALEKKENGADGQVCHYRLEDTTIKDNTADIKMKVWLFDPTEMDTADTEDTDDYIFEFSSNWEELEKSIKNCKKCKLCTNRTNIVFGVGNKDADVMLIGEGPGADEDRLGEPFVGKAGQLMNKAFQALEINRDEVYIANIVKCRPPQNRVPEADEAKACLNYLRNQVVLVKPKIIVLLGSTALKNIVGEEYGITASRGKWIEKKGIMYMPTWHPAALLRDETKKIEFWKDLKQVKQKADEEKLKI